MLDPNVVLKVEEAVAGVVLRGLSPTASSRAWLCEGTPVLRGPILPASLLLLSGVGTKATSETQQGPDGQQQSPLAPAEAAVQPRGSGAALPLSPTC